MPGSGSARELLDHARGDARLAEHGVGALDQAGSLGHDAHAPAVGEALAHVLDGAVGVAREARHGIRLDAHGHDLVDPEVLWQHVGGLESRQGPPAARAAGVAQAAEREEVAGREVDGRLRSRGGGVPRGVEELAVGVGEALRAGGDALGRDHGDGRVHRQVVGDGDEPVDEGRSQRLHALHRDALGDLREHLLEVRELVLHLAGALAHGRAQQQLAARRQLDRGDLLLERALVGDRERPLLVDLVAEELDAHGVVGDGREDVEDAAAHRELAAARDHVDARVREVDEPDGQLGEVVPAAAGGELHGRELGEVVRHGLEGRAHRRDDDERAHLLGGHLAGPLAERGVPLLHAAQRVDPLAHDLRARTEPLVRQRLPGRELEDLGVRQHRVEAAAHPLGLPTGGGDDEQAPRDAALDALAQEPREQRPLEPLGEGEVGVAGGRCEGVVERGGARERRDQALEDHQMIVRAATDALAVVRRGRTRDAQTGPAARIRTRRCGTAAAPR